VLYILYAAMFLSLTLVQINRAKASPILALINRWLRWAVFATGTAFLWSSFDLSGHPYWLLVLVFALIWFLGETLYNWMAVKALSESPLPLFPKYVLSESGEEWPVQPRFQKVRYGIRQLGYTHAQSVRAQIVEGIYVRASIYHDARAERRLQITFLPRPNSAVMMCASISSLTLDDHRYVTDNVFLPYAGFYPENWLVDRTPWTRSLIKLLARHNARLARANEALTPWTTDPLDDLNTQQRDLEQLNTQLGFLTPHAQREEHGKVTPAGRYRVWKEVWTLNYLGRSARYL